MNQSSTSSQRMIFADDGPRLVFAVATHQKTANLPLLLELVRRDSDDAARPHLRSVFSGQRYGEKDAG